jgi:transposase InsO family protein
LGVARSSYYHRRKCQHREPSEREQRNAELLEKIKAVFGKNKGRYGSPRVHAELKKQRVACSLGRVKRLMRREGLYATSNKKYRPKRECCDLETENLLLEQPRPTAINQVWHVDITYIATAEGWLYLAGVIDGFSKRIVGYAMSDNMRTDLVLQALRSAATRRKPPPGLIHHGDRGSQYTSYAYQRELETHKMLPSFTGKGACFDNAVIESFWSTLKRELVYPIGRFAARDDARVAVFEYIEVYYNRERLHSSLNYETPDTFELSQQQKENRQVSLAA